MKILTNKRYDALVSDLKKQFSSANCASGQHRFIAVFNKVRNTYQPQYAQGGFGAEMHNWEERDAMFDRVASGIVYCEFCGIRKSPAEEN